MAALKGYRAVLSVLLSFHALLRKKFPITFT